MMKRFNKNLKENNQLKENKLTHNPQIEKETLQISDKKNNPTQSDISSSKPIHRAIYIGLAVGFLISLFSIPYAPKFQDLWYSILPAKKLNLDQSKFKPGQLKNVLQRSINQVANLQRKLKRLTPATPYLIIDSSENLIYLKAGNKLLHQGVCSTGSYTLLRTVDGEEEWIFKTPRGMFRIQDKIENPVWRMPDWAFVEEGLPVPEPDSHERFEYGVLGDYALSLGDGYLIHGTLYQRFLGMPVTHGCIRLGDKELNIVYHSLRIGSKVFIY